LDSKIGEYVTIARKDRNSDEWFLGSITNSDARKIAVPLNFLKQGVPYKAEIYRDGGGADYKENPYPVSIDVMTVNSTSVLDLNLAPGGGTAVRFIPITN